MCRVHAAQGVRRPPLPWSPSAAAARYPARRSAQGWQASRQPASPAPWGGTGGGRGRARERLVRFRALIRTQGLLIPACRAEAGRAKLVCSGRRLLAVSRLASAVGAKTQPQGLSYSVGFPSPVTHASYPRRRPTLRLNVRVDNPRRGFSPCPARYSNILGIIGKVSPTRSCVFFFLFSLPQVYFWKAISLVPGGGSKRPPQQQIHDPENHSSHRRRGTTKGHAREERLPRHRLCRPPPP